MSNCRLARMASVFLALVMGLAIVLPAHALADTPASPPLVESEIIAEHEDGDTAEEVADPEVADPSSDLMPSNETDETEAFEEEPADVATITGDEQEVLLSPAATDLWEANLTPQINSTSVSLEIPGTAELIAQNLADTVTVRATMSYKGKVTRTAERTVSLSEIDASNPVIDVDFGTFGKFSATISFALNGTTVKSLPARDVAVTADTYNIAPLTATMPVTIFSLSLWGDGNIRTSGPSLIMLQRAAAYDWDALPPARDGMYGVYGIPYFTDAELRTQHDSPHAYFLNTQSAVIADYIRDLYAISPDAQFNFYFGDNFSYLVQTCIYANGIPSDQYTINALSDGTGSYTSTFSSHYTDSNPQERHSQLVSEWTYAKNQAYSTGKVREGFGSDSYDNVLKYVWPMIDSEQNALWWLTRPSLLSTSGDGNAFGSAVAASPKVKTFNIGNALVNLQAAGDDAVAEFKALYNFNDGYFSAAEEQGKDAMVFLGTRVDRENDFPEYARFVMEYYGDRYVYYYKGHPATPTDMHPSKAEQLKGLGITDVDATIAAELILFFNPEIYLSGYASSTYSSVPDGMGKGMFSMTKADGLANEMYRHMDFWVSPVTDNTPERARQLCTAGHSNFLVEFSDSVAAAEKYDIAIWDATDSIIIYYKLNEDGTYTAVKSEGSGKTGDTSLPEGIYYIQSALDNKMVLDNPRGSKNAGGNINIWSYNGGDNQRWRLSYDSRGMATLTNVASGLALDVTGGSSQRGTNIEQWTPKGNNAQKWNVKRNNDGTYTLYSAVGADRVADVDHARASNGANVLLWSHSGALNQKWYFLPLNPDIDTNTMIDIEDGFYTLAPKAAPSMRLDVANWSTSDGANLLIWNSTGGPNQVFRITRQPSGFYRLVNAFSGKSVDVDHASPISGTNVLQWTGGAGKANQEWAIYRLIDGSYTLRNRGTGLMLDLFGGSGKAGSNVGGWRPTNSSAQRWIIAPADDPASKAVELAARNASAASEGTYAIRSALQSAAVLDVHQASRQEGANVQIWNYKGAGNQKWSLTFDANGLATLKSVESGLALTYGRAVNEANVYQARVREGLCQKWVIVSKSGGKIAIVPAANTGLTLDLYRESSAPGTNVQLYRSKEHAGQQFTLQTV